MIPSGWESPADRGAAPRAERLERHCIIERGEGQPTSWSHVTITGHVVRAPRRRVAANGRVVTRLDLEIVNKLAGGVGESRVLRSSVEVVWLASHVVV